MQGIGQEEGRAREGEDFSGRTVVGVQDHDGHSVVAAYGLLVGLAGDGPQNHEEDLWDDLPLLIPA